MRLDKYIGHTTLLSRAESKKIIKKGVLVNGNIVKTPDFKIDEFNDEVIVNEKKLIYQKYIYIMMNKPKGVISATEDSISRTVIDLLEEKDCIFEPFPVGRLDKDTEGLLLLTDDGMLAHELLSPRKHVDKVYFAKVSGQFGENEIARFKEGLDIGNGERSKQARLQILKADVQESEVLITIMEGKFHQVKRMVKAVGSEVLYLKRLSMGSLKLDEELKLGEYRRLTKAELQELKEHRR